MKKDIVITIGGPHGSGRSTVAKAVAKHFNLRRFSTGEIFRKVAEERGISVDELNTTAEKEVDVEVDRRSKEEAEKGRVVMESDLAGWINKTADIKIWLSADLDKRAERVFNDEKSRIMEVYSSIEEAKKTIQKRDSADSKRYKEYYNIDFADLSIYDLIVDTGNLSAEEVINKVIEYIENKKS